MSAGIILIDGYNLLHAAGMAQSDYRPGDLLRCRTRLLKFLLSKLSAGEIKGTTVVFDARDPPPDRPAQVVISGIRVLFANPGGDADVLIQNWLSRHPSPRQVTLVSSDRVLQRAARGCGSKFVRSEDFVHELEQRHSSRTRERGTQEIDDSSKPGAHASSTMTAYWLKVFGDVSLADLVASDLKGKSATRAAAPKAKGESPAKPDPGRSRKPAVRDEAKITGNLEDDDLAYWMSVFGKPPTDKSGAASPDHLRLADLERWLKEFEATEEKTPKKRK